MSSSADTERFGFPTSDDELFGPKFELVRRGYEPQEVDAFIARASSRMAWLEQQLAEAQATLTASEAARDKSKQETEAKAKHQAYDQLAKRLPELLRRADMTADNIRREAQDSADKLLGDTRTRAEKLGKRADAEAERVRKEARRALATAEDEARRVIGSIASRRETLLSDLKTT